MLEQQVNVRRAEVELPGPPLQSKATAHGESVSLAVRTGVQFPAGPQQDPPEISGGSLLSSGQYCT